jgi:hypothetical protein
MSECMRRTKMVGLSARLCVVNTYARWACAEVDMSTYNLNDE